MALIAQRSGNNGATKVEPKIREWHGTIRAVASYSKRQWLVGSSTAWRRAGSGARPQELAPNDGDGSAIAESELVTTNMRRGHPLRADRPTHRLIATLLVGMVLSACGATATTPAPESRSPSVLESPVGSASAEVRDGEGVVELVAAMQAAVRVVDGDGYLRLVSADDPVFALEQSRWVADWVGPNPPTTFSLEVADVRADGAAATGSLTMRWATGRQGERTASFPVRFALGPEGWRYAGEDWQSTETEHFRVRMMPGLERQLPAIIKALPTIFEHVTKSLDYAPRASMEVKVYPDAASLVANTLLSLPEIRGWNEPGEALKLRVDPAIPSLTPAITHEFTHFVIFDRAGTKRSLMPWWLDEGVAVFVASEGEPASADSGRLGQVAAWASSGELPGWQEVSVFEETPQELWRYVYPMGYAMVRYVTEAYGDIRRNEWLAAMATTSTIDEATPEILHISFEDLDAAFRAWLRKV